METLRSATKKIRTTIAPEELKKLLFDGRSLRVPQEDLKLYPLTKYLRAAVIQAKELFDSRPPGLQNWQSPAWDFGRFAKAHPALIHLNENDALSTVKQLIGSNFWKAHLKLNPADAEMAFDDVWVNARAVPGQEPLTLAVIEAKKANEETNLRSPDGYIFFVEVARALQRITNGKPFLLPCHKLAPLLGCKPMTISRYRQKAIRDGFLEIVKEHSFRTSSKNEATEFRFLGRPAAEVPHGETT